MLVADVIAAFHAWNERHRTPATCQFYRSRLKRFAAQFGAMEFGALTSLAIDEYLWTARITRRGKPASGSTQRHNAVALQSLQQFALREKLIERPVFGTLEKPRIGRRERVPTADEIRSLLAGAPPEFVLLYRALCQCGARPGELCRLRIEEHIDWERRLLVIQEHKTARKTGKPRLIPIGAKLEKILREAIGVRSEGAVFLAPDGGAWKSEHVSQCHRRLRDKAGLDKELVLYLARHRFGTELIRAGEDIKTVADLMGHSSVKTTERYVHRDVTELRSKQDLID